MVHFTLGTIYTFGNMAPYIVSYIRNQSHPSDLSDTTSSWIFACALIGQGCSMFVGGWLVSKIGPRFTTLLGGWIMSAGVALSYLAIKVSFWLLLVTYGLLFGVGVGIAYIGPLTSAMKWMPRWKGLANGVVVAGFGLGALGFNALQTLYINPDNIEPVDGHFTSPEVIERVPSIFLIMGGVYAVIQLIGSLLITFPPPDYENNNDPVKQVTNAPVGQEEVTNEPAVAYSNSVSGGSTSSTGSMLQGGVALNGGVAESDEEEHEYGEDLKLIKDEAPKDLRTNDLESSYASSMLLPTNAASSLSPKQVLTKPAFYILWFMFLSNGMGVMFTATLYKIFGLQFIEDDHFLALVGSVSAIFNCAGRIVWGLLADFVSYKFCLVVMSAIMTIFMLTFYSTILGGKAMYFIWVCVIFFCVGGNFSLFPTAIGRAFGLKYASVNYGLLFTSQIFAGSLGALLSSLLKNLIGYYGLMFLVSSFSCIGMLLALLYRPKRYVTLLTADN